MTEKEKGQKGLAYNPNYDQKLIQERNQAKTICMEYNQLRPTQIKEKEECITQLLDKVGIDFLIEPSFYCDYGYNIQIGDHFYSNHNLIILDGAKVQFGDFVFIGPNCGFYTASHPVDVRQRNEGIEFAKPIIVGNNVWFGGNVVVLAGVTIGDNVTIGAGSIVTKDIPANVIAYGNPCRVIKSIE